MVPHDFRRLSFQLFVQFELRANQIRIPLAQFLPGLEVRNMDVSPLLAPGG